MDRVLPTAAIVVVLLVVLLLILVGWRRRVRRDRDAGAGYPAPPVSAAPSTPLAHITALYVATTKAGEPLERLALPGLSFRGKAELTVTGDGLTIAIAGESPVFITASALTGVGAATVAIDRVVERDGLVLVSWTTSGGAAADSYFRVVDPADREPLLAALDTILPAAEPAGPPTESEV